MKSPSPSKSSPKTGLARGFLTAAAAVVIGHANTSAQTTSMIDFDTAENWIQGGGSFTSYQDHGYSEGDWSFQGPAVIRNGTTAQDGFPGGIGTYSFRLRDAIGSLLSADYNAPAIIHGFGFDVRRWDGNPDPSYSVEYSIDGGANYLDAGTTINNAFLDNSSAFKTFVFSLPSPQTVSAGQFRVRISRVSGERIMVDNFQWTFEPLIDETAPALVTVTPSNGEPAAATDTTLSLSFDESVQSGQGNVLLYQGQSLVETFPATSGTYEGATVTFTPAAPLAVSTGYHVIVEATAIQDLAGNPFAGLLLDTDWAFTTAAPDTTPPAPTLFPADGSADLVATASLTLSYDEAVVLGTGTIEIRDAADSLVESFDVAASPRISLVGEILRIDPTAPLALEASYTVVVPAGVVVDLFGNPSGEIASPDGWSFTTRGIPAVVISQYYEGVGFNKYIELHNTTGAPVSLNGLVVASYSPSEAEGNQGWKSGVPSTRFTDLTGEIIPANGFFLIADPAATAPSYATPDIEPVFPSVVGFGGTASVVLYQAPGFAVADVIDAISITTNEGTDTSFYRQNNLPGFDFDPETSITAYLGTGQPWETKTVAEVDAASSADAWFLQGTIQPVELTLTLDPATVVENSATPVTATVTRSSGVGELVVSLEADTPGAITFVADDFVTFADGVTSAELEILPVDTPFAIGDRVVTLTATAGAGVVDGTAQLTIQEKPGDIPYPVVINEIDSDTVSTDVEEFIELYNNSSEEVSLDGATLVFFNGNDDVSYFALDLTGTIPANGFFVIGNAAVVQAAITIPDGSIQNGADAVALYYGVAASAFPNGTAVTAQAEARVDAIVYGTNDADDTGLLDALTPGGVQVNEGPSSDSVSIARVPDGGARFDTSVWVAQAPTPGVTNVISEPPANTLANWIGGFTVGAFTGPLDTPAGDGVPNVLKHVLGLAPDVAVTGSLVETSAAVPGSITFTHTRIKPGNLASDVVTGYEWSTNLADWTADGVSSGGVTVTFGAPVLLDASNPDRDLVEVTASVTEGAAGLLFVRIKADVSVP